MSQAQLAACAPKWPDGGRAAARDARGGHAETQADCLHLEVTLANVRASATASDAAIYQALQQSERAVRDAAHALTRLELERPAADDDDDDDAAADAAAAPAAAAPAAAAAAPAAASPAAAPSPPSELVTTVAREWCEALAATAAAWKEEAAGRRARRRRRRRRTGRRRAGRRRVRRRRARRRPPPEGGGWLRKMLGAAPAWSVAGDAPAQQRPAALRRIEAVARGLQRPAAQRHRGVGAARRARRRLLRRLVVDAVARRAAEGGRAAAVAIARPLAVADRPARAGQGIAFSQDF